MTIETQIHTLHDGDINAVIQIIGKSDGQSGQEVNIVKIDVSELVPSCDAARIDELTYNVFGGVVTLLWDDLTPLPFAQLQGQNTLCYRREGGLNNLADKDSRSGDILLSTVDFDGNGGYTILFKLRKKWD